MSTLTRKGSFQQNLMGGINTNQQLPSQLLFFFLNEVEQVSSNGADDVSHVATSTCNATH